MSRCFITVSCGFVDVGCPLRRKDGSIVYDCYWDLPAQSFFVPSPARHVTHFVLIYLTLPKTWWARGPYLFSPGRWWPRFIIRLANNSQSQSQNYLTTDGPSASLFWLQATIWEPRQVVLSFSWKLYLNILKIYYGADSLTRGWVCNSEFLLGIISANLLWSESHSTHDHILLSQFWDSPSLECHVSLFPPERGLQIIPPGTGFPLYRL
jgi:hypothetical protein